jgi:hypothetical protein
VPATTLREHRRMKGAGDLWFQAFVRIARNRHHPAACDASGVPPSIIYHGSEPKEEFHLRWSASLPQLLGPQ